MVNAFNVVNETDALVDVDVTAVNFPCFLTSDVPVNRAGLEKMPQ